MANILFLDNFDSFTYNLVDQFRVLGHNVKIYRNDTNLEQVVQEALNTPDTILALSPGPGTPAEAGILLPLIERLKMMCQLLVFAWAIKRLFKPLVERLYMQAKYYMVKYRAFNTITKPCLKILPTQCLWHVITL